MRLVYFRADFIFVSLERSQKAGGVACEIMQDLQVRTQGIESDAVLRLDGAKVLYESVPDEGPVHEAGIQRV